MWLPLFKEGSSVSSESVEIAKLKEKVVEVVDTINGNSTVYSSINLAAQAIGCAPSTICRALKNLKEKESRLIKKRFLVKPQ